MTNELEKPTIPSLPDVSKLPVLNFESMLVKVVDQTSAKLANSFCADARTHIENVAVMFDKPTKDAHAVHRFLTGLRAKFIKPAQDVITHNDNQLLVYNRKLSDDARALEQQARRNAEAEAKRQRDAELSEAMLFGGSVAEIEAKPLEIMDVFIPAPKAVATAKKPWAWELDPNYEEPLLALIKSIAEGKTSLRDAAGDAIVIINESAMTKAARYYQDKLHERFPGVVSKQEERIKR